MLKFICYILEFSSFLLFVYFLYFSIHNLVWNENHVKRTFQNTRSEELKQKRLRWRQSKWWNELFFLCVVSLLTQVNESVDGCGYHWHQLVTCNVMMVEERLQKLMHNETLYSFTTFIAVWRPLYQLQFAAAYALERMKMELKE